MKYHTLGPWHVVKSSDGIEIVTAAGNVFVATVTGELPDDNDEADATLLAAAPEMIYALQLAQSELNEMGCECDCENASTRCPVCAVNSAIEKATLCKQ